MTVDLGPAARQMADLVRSTPDELLAAPTPCTTYSVGDLLDHIGGLAKAFTFAATKESLGMPDQTASGDGSRLEANWRATISADVIALAAAWEDPTAWTGMTKAGPIEMPGEIAGLVALDEVVVHGWDLAVATGQEFSRRRDDPRWGPNVPRDVLGAGHGGRSWRRVRAGTAGPRLCSSPRPGPGHGRPRQQLATMTMCGQSIQ